MSDSRPNGVRADPAPAFAPAPDGEPPCPDFLPPAHHAARGAARVRVWRLTAAAAAGLLIAAGLLGGLWRTQRLRAARDGAVARAAALGVLDDQAAALRADLAAAADRAAVLAGLHLRPPASRLLADLAAAAPAGVTFTDLALARLPAPPAGDDADEPADPAAADARRLARRRRGERLEVRLGGTAPSDAAIAGLLSRAAAGGAFDAVELLFTDRAPDRRATDRRAADGPAPARVFSARLTARPAAAAD